LDIIERHVEIQRRRVEGIQELAWSILRNTSRCLW
jgi:hypothetical protein